MTPASARIRVGIGGWNYQPWRETFYPAGVAKKDELEYASRQVTAIEINSTFYRLQKPQVFAKWRDSTPEDFQFSLKAPRFVTQRNRLAEAGAGVERFVSSGIAELGSRLGPLLWQLAPTHSFDGADVDAFLGLLPPSIGGVRLRHVVEVRHPSFMHPEFVAIAREHGCAIVLADDDTYPAIANATADFVYARLRRSVSTETTGYAAPALAQWAQRARLWASGMEPKDLPRMEEPQQPKTAARDVFIYFINGAKERAPAAAVALRELLNADQRA